MNRPAAEMTIANLVHGLALAIDDADGDRIEELTEHLVFTMDDHPPVEGGAAFRRMIERGMVLHDGSPRTQHVVTNLVVDADDVRGLATSHCYVTVFQAVDGFPLQAILSARYRDEFVRENNVWRFDVRHMHVVLRGDTSHHSTQEM
jgi:hypothetical protein